MLLAIDVGNTNAKFALYDGAAGQPLARWRIATDDRRTADEYMVWLDQLLRIEGTTGAPSTRSSSRPSYRARFTICACSHRNISGSKR